MRGLGRSCPDAGIPEPATSNVRDCGKSALNCRSNLVGLASSSTGSISKRQKAGKRQKDQNGAMHNVALHPFIGIVSLVWRRHDQGVDEEQKEEEENETEGFRQQG